VNILAWFDNEWGFANRMLDVAEHYLHIASAKSAFQNQAIQELRP